MQVRSINSSAVTTTTDIAYDLCGTAFDSVDATTAATLNIPTLYYCPTDDDYNIKGSFFSDEYRYVQLDITK